MSWRRHREPNRRRLSALALAALATLILATVVPASAPARGTVVEQFPDISMRMWLHGSNGYLISIENIDRRHVALEVSPANAPFHPLIDSATYTGPGRVTTHSLEADFGRLGHVSVHFHGHPAPVPRRGRSQSCRGRRPLHEVGRFEGTIRFEGEQGFTSVSAKGAKGFDLQRFSRTCHVPDRRPLAARAPRRIEDEFATELNAVETTDRRAISVEASKYTDSLIGALSTTLVTVTERRGRVQIQRTVYLDGEQGSVQASALSAKPVTARVSMPPPFSGTGTYSKEAGSPAGWSGDLSVEVPGAGIVPLTGPSFSAALCRGNPRTHDFEHCEFEAEELTEAVFKPPYFFD